MKETIFATKREKGKIITSSLPKKIPIGQKLISSSQLAFLVKSE